MRAGNLLNRVRLQENGLDLMVLIAGYQTITDKSRNNAISLPATADETARLLRQAKTDSDPHITYDPQDRPEVANLVLLTALCEELGSVGEPGAVERSSRTGHDIPTFPGHAINGYTATPGWDPVTGWGSPNAQALIPLLVRYSGH